MVISSELQLIGVREAASILGVSKTTFYRRIIGSLPNYQIGGRTAFRVADLREFVEQQRSGGPREVGAKRCTLPNRYDLGTKAA